MLLADLLQAGREVRRHVDEAALALHGLEHDAGDGGRIDVLLKQPVQGGDRVVGRDAAIEVRRGRPVDLAREGSEALLVRDDLRRHRHRQARAAVERVVEDDYGGSPGGGACDLHRVLDGFGPGVQEHGLGLTVARPRLVEQLADLDVGLVHPDHEALVQIAVDLLVDRRRGEAVARVLAAESAGEVDVLAAVHVPDARAFRTGDDERCGRDPTRDVAVAIREDARGLGCLFDAS